MRRFAPLALLLCLLSPSAAHAAPEPRIVGGQDAPIGAYPWQVALVERLDPDTAAFCGGALLSDTRVITAAHCVEGSSASEIDVVANSTQLGSGGTRHRLASIGVHPQNDADELRYDVAILRLSTPVPNARSIAPIAASPSADDAFWAPGDRLTVTGYGETGSGPSTRLQYVEVPRVSDADCASAYPGGFLEPGFHAEDMFCAGELDRDSCFGDSGGPIVAPVVDSPDAFDPDDWRLAGVVSWGPPDACGEMPQTGIYARLGAPAISNWFTQPPANLARPGISGELNLVPGSRVACTPGAWSGDRATYSYEFLRLTPDGGRVSVQNGAGASYLVTLADVDSSIACRVTARNSVGEATAESDALGPVVLPPPADPPAGGDGGGSQITPPPPVVDRIRPRSGVLSRVCGRRSRRCSVRVAVTDAAPSAGIAGVDAVMRWTERRPCTRRGRRMTCAFRRSRALTGKRVSDGRFRVRTPKLRRGVRYSLRIVAVDNEGNEQLVPTATSVRLPRRPS